MSFISGYFDKRKQKVQVWERLPSGSRVKQEYDPPYYFYETDRLGDYETVTNVRVKKIEFSNENDFQQAVDSTHASNKFESDISPLERVLMDNYSKRPVQALTVGMIDIEVDSKKALGGFKSAKPKSPLSPINAVTIYFSKTKQYLTLSVPPQGWDWNTKLPEELSCVHLCKNETELLELFLDSIHDVDILTGWNSEFYDIPYIAKRIELVFGESSIRRLAFEEGPMPYWSEKDRFKNAKVKDLVLVMNSRIHLDYMLLFKKFNLDPRQSFKLDAIGQDEVSIPKIKYPGSLETLYNNDFLLFLKYNINDVHIIVKLDEKFRYIEQANQIVHMATVNFGAVFGSVQLIDSAIINFAHNTLNKIVFDKVIRPEGPPVEGAIVMTPIPGFYKWIAAVDINSLYPNTIRSMNLSVEKIVGQLSNYEAGWKSFYWARFDKTDETQNVPLTILFEHDNEPINITAGELVELCEVNKWSVSGYGTILDQSNGPGILPTVLGAWFKGRKELQAEKKKYAKIADGILDQGYKLSTDELHKLKELGLV